MSEFDRALAQFDAKSFCDRHRGHKESRSERSKEWLLTCRCGSERLRWHHNPPKKSTWICWGCGRTGDTVALISWLEGISSEQAVERVLDGYVGGDAPTHLGDAIQIRRPHEAVRVLPTIELPRGFTPLHQGHHLACEYLIGRGVDPALVAQRGAGFVASGYLKNYLIFPCYMGGSVVYWQGRACWDPPRGVSPEQRKAWVKSTRYRKTMNPSRDSDEQAGASEILLGYDGAYGHEHVVVVEGPLDATQVGLHAVAMLGKKPSVEKIDRLCRMPARIVTIYLDRGVEEQQYAKELGDELSAFMDVRVAVPPEGYDPGKLTPQQNAAVIQQAVSFHTVSGLQSGLTIR